MVLGLGKQDRQCAQLGLAARQGFPSGQGGIVDAPVGAVRADRGEAIGQIAITRDQQRIR